MIEAAVHVVAKELVSVFAKRENEHFKQLNSSIVDIQNGDHNNSVEWYNALKERVQQQEEELERLRGEQISAADTLGEIRELRARSEQLVGELDALRTSYDATAHALDDAAQLRKQISEFNNNLRSNTAPNLAAQTRSEGNTRFKMSSRDATRRLHDQSAHQRTTDRPDRRRNLVVVGLAKRPSDSRSSSELVSEFFVTACSGPAHIEHARALMANSGLLLVTFTSIVEKTRVLRECTNHGLSGQYAKVRVREDLSRAEQVDFKNARDWARKRNAQLGERLDNPFRYVVHKRTGRPVCIDVKLSTEQKRYVFKQPEQLSSQSEQLAQFEQLTQSYATVAANAPAIRSETD